MIKNLQLGALIAGVLCVSTASYAKSDTYNSKHSHKLVPSASSHVKGLPATYYLKDMEKEIGRFKAAGCPSDKVGALTTVLQADYDKMAPTGYFNSGDGLQVEDILMLYWGVHEKILTPLKMQVISDFKKTGESEAYSILFHRAKVGQIFHVKLNRNPICAGAMLDGTAWVPLTNILDAVGCETTYDTKQQLIALIPAPPVTVQTPVPPPVQVEVTPQAKRWFTDKTSLTGIKFVSVTVNLSAADFLKQQLASQGVTEDQIKTEVELKLRSSGISVLDNAADGILYLNLAMLSAADGCCYSVSLSFRQPVRLSSDLTSFGLEPTWDQSGVGTSPMDGVHTYMTDQIGTYISSFCNDYLAANPITR